MKKVIVFLTVLSAFFCLSLSANASTASNLGLSENSFYNILQNQIRSPYNYNSATSNVNTYTGEASHKVTDLVLPGKNGHNVEIKREYGNQYLGKIYYPSISDRNYYAEMPYIKKGYIYKDQQGYSYLILFNCEEDMLELAPESFYMRENYLNYSWSSIAQNSRICYSYFNIVNNYNKGILLTRDKTVSGDDVTIYKRTIEKIYNESTFEYKTRLINNWNFVFPYLWATYSYDKYNDRDYQGYFRDMDDNILTIEWYYEKEDKEIGGFRASSNAPGYKFNIINRTQDITEGNISYNKTIVDPKGRTYYINWKNKLIACDDKYGNRILYNVDGITGKMIDSVGRTILYNSEGVVYTNPGETEEHRITYTSCSYNDNEADPENTLTTDNDNQFIVTYEDGSQIKYHHQSQMWNMTWHGESTVRTAQYAKKEKVYLLRKITYPNGDERHYDYDKKNIYFYDLGSQNIFKVIRQYDIIDGKKVNEYTYTYNNPNEGRENDYLGTVTTVTTRVADNHTQTDYFSSSYGYHLQQTRTSSGITTDYQYNSRGSTAKITENTQNNNGYVQTKSYRYTNNGMLQSEAEGNYNATYTYDDTYNMMLTKTYKQDADTTIKIENTLTEDKKSVASQKTYVNNVLSTQTDFEYDIYGNVIKTSSWADDYDNDNIADENEIEEISAEYIYNADASSEIVQYANNISNADGASSNISTHQYYNNKGYLYKTTDALSRNYFYHYDENGRLTKAINADNTEVNLEYDVSENSTVKTDENGNKIKEVYYLNGDLKEKYILLSGEWKLLEENINNNYGLLLTNIKYILYNEDRSNDTFAKTTYTYDNQDRVVKKQITNQNDEILNTVNYSYSVVNGQLVVTEDIGDSWAKKKKYYDTVGNLVKEETIGSAQTKTISYEYDYLKNLLKTTDPLNCVTTYTYDFMGNVLSETNANNEIKSYVYDKKGRLAKNILPNNAEICYEYDALDRVIQTTQESDNTLYSKIKTYYDAVGNVITTKTLKNIENGEEKYNITTTSYNLKNLPVTVAVGENDDRIVTSYEYDNKGNMTSSKLGETNPQRTAYEYNELDQLVRRTDPLGQTESFINDNVGNVISHTDRNGITTISQFNALGQILSVTSGNEKVCYEYNDIGLQTKVYNPDKLQDMMTYSYDEFARLSQYTQPGNVVNTYTYNPDDTKASFVMTKDGETELDMEYTYDNLKRLSQVNSQQSGAEYYTYDSLGNLLTITGGGRNPVYTYDAFGKMISVTDTNGENTFVSENYTYYFDGNKKTKTDNIKNTLTEYSYYNNGMLEYEMYSSGMFLGYVYDEYGNRIKKTERGTENPLETEYIYDQNNRLIKEEYTDTHSYPYFDTVTKEYEYSPNGNLHSKIQTIITGTSDENMPVNPAENIITVGILGYPKQTEEAAESFTSVYSYDSFNRLKKVLSENTNVTYEYLPDGMRKNKTVNGVTTSHIWDGENVVEDITNADKTKYLRGINLISLQNNNNTYYYHFDGHGDTKALSINDEIISYDYDAFGNQLTNTDTANINPFRYSGEYYDAETGNIYLRNRYYNIGIGRFISEDTHWNTNNMIYGDKEYKDGETKIPDMSAIMQSSNLYAYCMNNPVKYIDPSGEVAEWVIVALYGYAQAVITSPDLQYDMQILAYDISQGDYVSAAFDVVDILAPGFSGSKTVPKFIRKYFDDVINFVQCKKFDDILNSSTFIRKTKGGTEMYSRVGGYKKAVKDFNALSLTNVKKYDNGTVTGVMKNGTKVNLHQSHTDNMRWTIEMGNKKIRYEEK